MNWVCNFSREALKDLRYLPRNRQNQISKAIEALAQNPLSGDVRLIKHGKFGGAMRNRIGHYRIIFDLDHKQSKVKILAITYRGDNTYN